MKTSSLRAFALLLAAGLVVGVHPLSASASVLMLDWGSTTVGPDDADNSPYHAINGSFTDTSWNKLGQSVPGGGLVWSDGTAASGLSIVFGKNATDGEMVIHVNESFTGSVSGTEINTGIYADTSVGRDGVYMNNGGPEAARAVGLQLAGLAPGDYDIYLVGRHTNSTADYDLHFYAEAGSSGDFDFSGYATESVSYAGSDADDAWLFDADDPSSSNYVRIRVSITAENPYLNVASIGDSGSAQAHGFLNAMQIVTVPEPASVVLVGTGALMVICRRRRRG